MFDKLLNALRAPEPDPLDQGDARLALTALLVRVARTDGHFSDDEASLIDRIVAQRYSLSPFEASKLRGEAEALEAEAPDTVRFTRAIKSGVAYEDRAGVIESLWAVVLADGARDEFENAMMRTVAPLLGVSDKDSALARQKVSRD